MRRRHRVAIPFERGIRFTGRRRHGRRRRRRENPGHVAIPFERGIRFTVFAAALLLGGCDPCRNPLRAGHPVHGIFAAALLLGGCDPCRNPLRAGHPVHGDR